MSKGIVVRVEVVAQRTTRKAAERYIRGFTDELGNQISWVDNERVPVTIEWAVVPHGRRFDIVSTVRLRNEEN